MRPQALLQDLERAGVRLSIVAEGQLAVDGPRAVLDRWLPEVRIAKAELLAILSRPANAPAPPHLWRVTTPEGEVFSLSRTPPANRDEIEADYPGCTVEVEVEPPVGAALHPDDLDLAHAYLRHVGEDDLAIGQEWIAGLAADPARQKLMHAEVVRLGVATFDPAPEQPIETRATAQRAGAASTGPRARSIPRAVWADASRARLRAARPVAAGLGPMP